MRALLYAAAAAAAIVGGRVAEKRITAIRRRADVERAAAGRAVTLDAQADNIELRYNQLMAERDRRYAELTGSISDRAYRECKAQCEWDAPVAWVTGRNWCAPYLPGCREAAEKRLQAEADKIYAQYSDRLAQLAAQKRQLEARLTEAQRRAIL